MSFSSHVGPHDPLVEIVPGLWQVTSHDGPLQRNMAVWRLPGGGTCLHSVVACDEPTMARIEALGPPGVIIVPNGFHRRDPGVYRDRYPTATVLAPAASRARVEQVCRVDGNCEDGLAAAGVKVHVPHGVRPGELAYEVPLPGGGSALVVADLLFNIPTAPPGFKGFVLRYVTASVGPLGISRVFRLLALADRRVYADWLESLAGAADWRALVVAHGDAVTGDVPEALRSAARRVRG